MEIRINIEKKHFYVLLGVILIGFGSIFVIAGQGDGNPATYTVGTVYHYLQDVVKDDAKNSVDSDNDGIIDRAEDADTLDGLHADEISGRWSEVTGGITYSDGNVGIGVVNQDPTIRLHVDGKIKSISTSESDEGTVVATKDYVDAISTYNNCGWRDGTMCNDGELMQGSSSGQSYCCGPSPITCTATDWTTISSGCLVNNGCGCGPGTTQYYQQRTLSNCLLESRTTTGGSCTATCFYGTCDGCTCQVPDLSGDIDITTSVICTEFYREGLLDEESFMIESRYASEKISPELIRGYHSWAIPFTRLMRKDAEVKEVGAIMVKGYVEEVLYRAGYKKEGNELGKILLEKGGLACIKIGKLIEQPDWRSLFDKNFIKEILGIDSDITYDKNSCNIIVENHFTEEKLKEMFLTAKERSMGDEILFADALSETLLKEAEILERLCQE